MAVGTAATRRLFPCLADDLPMSAAAVRKEAEATKRELAAVKQELAELKAWKAALSAKELKQDE